MTRMWGCIQHRNANKIPKTDSPLAKSICAYLMGGAVLDSASLQFSASHYAPKGSDCFQKFFSCSSNHFDYNIVVVDSLTGSMDEAPVHLQHNETV
ncbi:unnamed protein product [Allacma fusca]|uniref:Uncharacterized protein n=1 Tax=Allacma fusca TaxID=39272 RepID=A0A8J2J9L1_9HEXA|nr:unnamed protein product [Allacma fusca]